ncbi:MAG: hypothetical protein RIA72_06485 [Sphingopyxis sp.]|jgi:hypothetical protein|uniref:hypothetical protein n=1 Tax=Sphingopyxis sp. TaxID=1908224 RepID=UPI0032EB63E3
MISLLLALSLSAAAPATTASPEPHHTDKPAKPKKVCQKVEMTGSSVPKRVCRTITEPAKPEDATEQAATEKPATGSAH